VRPLLKLGWMLNSVVLVTLSVSWLVCCAKQKEKFYDFSQKIDRLTIEFSDIDPDVQKSDKQIYVITTEAKRIPILSPQWDFSKKTLQLSLAGDADHFYSAYQTSSLDTHLAMGRKLSSMRQKEMILTGDVFFLRLEIFQKKAPSQGNMIHYWQGFIPFRYDIKLAKAQQVYPLEIAFQRVGVLKIKVKGHEGNALAQVNVAPVLVEKLPEAYQKKSSLKYFWEHHFFRPVISTTDDKGETRVYPIALAKNKLESAYQIFVFKEGLCGHWTSVSIFNQRTLEQEIQLPKCSPSASNAPAKWMMSFSEDFHSETITVDQKKVSMAFIDKDKVNISIQSQGEHYFGFLLEILNEFQEFTKIFHKKKYPLFSHQIEVDFPFHLKSTGGDITIKVTPLLTEKIKPLYLYARLRDNKDLVLDTGKVKIFSSTKVQGIISGQEGQNFLIRYEDCYEGYQLSVKYLESLEEKRDFFPCTREEHKVAEIPFASIYFDHPQKTTESYGLKVYIKDLYGHISIDDKNIIKSDEAPIVLFDPPIFNPVLEINIRIRPHDKIKAEKVDEQWQITADNISTFSIKLSNVCPGEGKSPINQIFGYFLLSEGEKPEKSLSEAHPCAEPKRLVSGDVQFPKDAKEEATVALKFLSVAGVMIPDVKYIHISACKKLGENLSGICWKGVD